MLVTSHRSRKREGSGTSSMAAGSKKQAGGVRGGGAEPVDDWTAPLASTVFGISIILLVEFVARGPGS
jgi:hypothetical protein